MCIGMRACNPMATSWTKCRNSKAGLAQPIDTIFHAMAPWAHPLTAVPASVPSTGVTSVRTPSSRARQRADVDAAELDFGAFRLQRDPAA